MAQCRSLRDTGLIPGCEYHLEEEYPLRYSCLENPMDRGAWWATAPGFLQSQISLKWLSTHTCV